MRSVIVSLIFFVFMISCSSGDKSSATVQKTVRSQGQSKVVDEQSQKNILQIALGSADHTTLVAGVQAAELEDVLVNAGPLTVFAPTNAAFDKLPAGTLSDLLKAENKGKLRRIITSHAAPGTYEGEGLRDGMKLYMATGDYVDVEVREGKTFVNGIEILASIDASNGVVHVVDEVFLLAGK
jgi:uncharacterized surface protein with fasciclin (FAS1) repeats